MKKISIVLISLLVLLGSISVVYGSEDQLKFTDVKKSDYYYNSVSWALNNKVTDGTSNTTFSPDATCTRAQVVTFLWRSMGQPEPISTVNKFSDVSVTDWFYKPVLWAVEKGITDGTSATTFSPTDKCKNSHILTFIYRAIGEPDKTGTGAWYTDALNWVEKNKLNNGTYTGQFDLNAFCNRANVVEYLYRYDLMKKGVYRPAYSVGGVVAANRQLIRYTGPSVNSNVVQTNDDTPGSLMTGDYTVIKAVAYDNNVIWYNIGALYEDTYMYDVPMDCWIADDGSALRILDKYEAAIAEYVSNGYSEYESYMREHTDELEEPIDWLIKNIQCGVMGHLAATDGKYYYRVYTEEDALYGGPGSEKYVYKQSINDPKNIQVIRPWLNPEPDLMAELYIHAGETVYTFNSMYYSESATASGDYGSNEYYAEIWIVDSSEGAKEYLCVMVGGGYSWEILAIDHDDMGEYASVLNSDYNPFTEYVRGNVTKLDVDSLFAYVTDVFNGNIQMDPKYIGETITIPQELKSLDVDFEDRGYGGSVYFGYGNAIDNMSRYGGTSGDWDYYMEDGDPYPDYWVKKTSQGATVIIMGIPSYYNRDVYYYSERRCWIEIPDTCYWVMYDSSWDDDNGWTPYEKAGVFKPGTGTINVVLTE